MRSGSRAPVDRQHVRIGHHTMDLDGLRARLARHQGCVQVLDRGTLIAHSYAKLARDIDAGRAKLQAWGVTPGMRVGLYAPNCYEWLVFDLALIDLKAIAVPFTRDFSGSVNDALLAKYKVSILLTTKEMAGAIDVEPSCVAWMDSDGGCAKAKVFDQSLTPEPDTLSWVFSSGSAGGIKGIVISRKGVEACIDPIMEAVGLSSRDKFLLFLPMSNFQQRLMSYAALWYGASIAIIEHTQLYVGMRLCAPTILVAPPVFFQMLHQQFLSLPLWQRRVWRLLGHMLGLVFVPAIRQTLARFFFKKLLGQLGGRIRLLVTGMAPIKPDVAELFFTLKIPLCETYGLVETGSLTFRDPGCRKFTSVGQPLRGVDVHVSPEGEIIVERAYPLSLGYFDCAPGEQERTFLAPGKVATGDIGVLDSEGYLYLRGRKNALLVAPNGYKVHPEALEREVDALDGVVASLFFKRPNDAHLSCVVVLKHSDDGPMRQAVRRQIAGLEACRKISPFIDVIFAPEPFTVENGMLRPNMKLDRQRIVATYAGKDPPPGVNAAQDLRPAGAG